MTAFRIALVAACLASAGCASSRPSAASCLTPEFTGLSAIDARTMDHPPRMTELVGADFPREDRARHRNGAATVRAVIAADGSVLCSDVLQATTRGIGRAAQEVVHASRYEPGRVDGQPVTSVLVGPITFETRSSMTPH